jgi:Domain of unknown function (DUF5666)
MRIVIGVLAAAHIGLAGHAANAADVLGPIEAIDPTYGTITVAGEVFTVTEDTRGLEFEALQEGDVVKIYYIPIQVDEAFDALLIKKEEIR